MLSFWRSSWNAERCHIRPCDNSTSATSFRLATPRCVSQKLIYQLTACSLCITIRLVQEMRHFRWSVSFTLYSFPGTIIRELTTSDGNFVLVLFVVALSLIQGCLSCVQNEKIGNIPDSIWENRTLKSRVEEGTKILGTHRSDYPR